MSISVITVGGQSVNVVSLPTAPGLRMVEFNVTNAVAYVPSPFTGQGGQAQQWPGADMWSGTMTLPLLTQAQAQQWIAALMQMRGMANAMLIGDPLGQAPAGSVAGTPLIDDTVAGGNAAMSQTLGTKGWTPGATGVLLRGDYIGVGYRMHRALDDVDADGSGKATIPISPSIREVPTDSSSLITSGVQGLFRLANNKLTWSADEKRLTRLSFQLTEYR